jgi:hypothetical protein
MIVQLGLRALGGRYDVGQKIVVDVGRENDRAAAIGLFSKYEKFSRLLSHF